MSDTLLITMTRDEVARTFVFDGAADSILQIADDGAARTPLASVCREGEAVAIVPARGCELCGAQGDPIAKATCSFTEEAVLSLRSADGGVATLYVRASTAGARTFGKIGFSYDADITIGRAETCGLVYPSRFVSSHHATLSLVGEVFTISDAQSANGTFVNGRMLPHGGGVRLCPGDIVQIMDLVVMIGHRFIALNFPTGLSLGSVPGAGHLDHAAFAQACPAASETDGVLPLFYPAPRLAHSVHARAFQIDDPPMAKKPDDQPALMQLGPSFIMGLASIFMVSSAVSRLMGGADAASTVPMIAMSCSMIVGMVVWPIISKRYTKRRDARDELRRASAYSDYLNGMEAKFGAECETQASILRTARVDVPALIDRALDVSPRLMNRGVDQDDFMGLRVGIGDADLAADIRWPQHRFTMDDDALLDKVSALAAHPPRVHDVPLVFNPAEHRACGIVGSRERVWSFARGLIVQIAALYSYQDVKICLVADAAEEDEWGFMRMLPHAHDDAGVARRIATDADALMELGMGFERELEARSEIRAEVPSDLGAYYVVVCASAALAERSEVLSRLIRLRQNKGFSLLYFGEGLSDLPRDCDYVIDLSGAGADLFGVGRSQDLSCDERDEERAARMFARGDVSGTMRAFDPDIYLDAAVALRFSRALARVHLDLPSQRSSLPTSLGFLEMFKCGSVAHLNIGRRWAESDASRTLQTPVGLDAQGEFSMLNLHEKIHGPHGLIAGTTGSGKSEFIITYILSMCVNYPPDQVAFVLIDYKGGGLAGAFDNDRITLPHLAGTITNLDGAAISRSLVSIKSELKRRQDLLNQARDITGEATVDIYKYLSYYRQGVLTEPLPHLFIVADEFAELKQQEPEFMDELISAARIGRSLGVHLILATQKPSGVVNDQIWSNSRFKVCLKVADAADSKEMIKRPEAAEIKEPGRFYLLVGYNEYFAAGQAAYAGAGYAEADEFEPRRDNAVELIDDAGSVVAALRPATRAQATNTSEMNAVLARICETARTTSKQADALWLDPLPLRIVQADLEERYAYERPEAGLVAVVGELDDPERQRQGIETVDFAQVGNVLLYGGQASGVDGLAQSLLFSLACHYGPDELALYAIDLDAGLLSSLEVLPQCGGVVMAGDEERLGNLFKLIEGEIIRRRKLFAQAGGSLERYNEQAERPLPRIVIAITNMAAFYELYADFEERISSIARDAPRYGMHLLVTASGATVLRMRMKASFGAAYVTSFNDPNDYVTVFGSMSGVVAPHADKRGLVKRDKAVFEFQGASIAETPAEEAAQIRAVAERWRAASAEHAAPIPVLPERVTVRDLGSVGCAPHEVPVGFSKEDVAPAAFEFARSPYMLVLGNDLEGIGRYLRGMREALASSETSYLFVDLDGVLGPVDDARVLTNLSVAESVLDNLLKGLTTPEVLVFTSIVQTIAGLPTDLSGRLQTYLAKEECVGKTGIVAASEMWRAKGIYQDWFKVVTAYANGVWVGSGFTDQSVFRFARALPAYRVPAQRSDGFYALRGDVMPVRLIEATDEPGEDDDA